MADILNQLEKIVKDNINQVEMGVLKREMDRLQKIEVEFVSQREELKLLRKQHGELKTDFDKKLAEIESITSREKTLFRKETEMAKQQTELYIHNQLIELKLKNAELRVVDHQNMVNIVFRGPVFQKTVVENRNHDVSSPVNISDHQGLTAYPIRETLNDNKTTSTTEEST